MVSNMEIFGAELNYSGNVKPYRKNKIVADFFLKYSGSGLADVDNRPTAVGCANCLPPVLRGQRLGSSSRPTARLRQWALGLDSTRR
jgi:hypothetical protein